MLNVKKRYRLLGFALTLAAGFFTLSTSAQKKPNILVIMGDDVGWFNIGAYHQGMMSGN